MSVNVTLSTTPLNVTLNNQVLSVSLATQQLNVSLSGVGPQGPTGATGPQGPPGPQGPSAVWGEIIGTITNQTDLQAEFSNYLTTANAAATYYPL